MILGGVIILASGMSLIIGLLVAATVVAMKNAKEQRKMAIKEYKQAQRYARIEKWRSRAIEWDIERKKPVKVQFD